MKQHLKYIIPAALIIGAVAFFISVKRNANAPIEQDTPARRMEQINKIPVKDRPYVTLTPRTDGREVTMIIDNIKNATRAEYELEYQAGSMIQGVFGTIDFSKETLPVSKKLLFGTCSKGKCRYDENVSGGSLTIRFEGSQDPYILKTDFNLQQMADREGVFTSKDIKASLDIGKAGLPVSSYVVVIGTMGPPAPVEGDIIAGPYSFLSTTSPRLTSAELTIQFKDDLADAQLLQWSGQTWTELASKVGNNKISAPVTSLGTFVLVKPATPAQEE